MRGVYVYKHYIPYVEITYTVMLMNETRMWFTGGTQNWRAGMHVGTGRLAGTLFGTPSAPRFLVNHEWLWRGKNMTRDTVASDALPEVRRLLLSGDYAAGSLLANQAWAGDGGVLIGEYGTPEAFGREYAEGRVDPYQPAAEICFRSTAPETGEAANRSLSLTDAIADITDANVSVEAFGSVTHDLLFLRFEAKKSPVSGVLTVERIADEECTLYYETTERRIAVDGLFQDGIDFRVEATVVACDGQVRVEGDALHISDVSELVLAVDIGTSAQQLLPRKECAQHPIPTAGWTHLREEHLSLVRPRLGRTLLHLTDAADDRPTDVRLADPASDDVAIAELFYNYGKYLLFCASETAELPINFQGRWNGDLKPRWESDFHNNSNLQLSYWPMEQFGFNTLPLVDYIERAVPRARKAARDLYGCRGVLYPLQTDAWGRATPESFGYGVWIGGAAWLAQHMWWRYEYSLDRDYLRNSVVPFLEETALFYEDYLIEDAQGVLQIVPSQSPENSFVDGGPFPISLGVSSTMDVALATEALTNLIRAYEVLDIEAERRVQLQQIVDRLPGPKTGSHGQLLEWNEEFEEAEPGHRHVSHLYGLFPGSAITPETTPELVAAARISLEDRIRDGAENPNGGTNHPLFRATLPYFEARLREGDRAGESIAAAIRQYPLLEASRLDVLFAVPSAIHEMLLQDHNGTLRFLPALPSAWRTGALEGVRARGGLSVDLRWDDAILVSAKLRAENDVSMTLAVENAYELRGSDGSTATVTDAEPTVFRAGVEYDLVRLC
jgi:alpha-L-fucosidase 2